MRIGMSRRKGRSSYRLLLVAGLVGTVTVVCVWGRGFLPRAFAQLGATPTTAVTTAEPAGEWANRPVAYINNTQVVTMKDLGEYLIKREGADKLELLVNKLIIEDACKKQGVEVTAAEVDASLQDDLKGMSGAGPLISEKDFVSKILRRYNKSLYEWKEDVIRPRLLLGKLCRNRVKVTDEDLHNAFEAYYGERVRCKLILFPREEKARVMEIYAKLRDNPAEFEAAAKQQASSQLAASAGDIAPFGRHTTGNEELEKEAFSMQPGQISRVVETPEGLVILKLLEKLPAKKDVQFDKVRPALEKEIVEKKIKAEIPVCFKELRDRAAPTLLMKKVTYESDLLRDAQREISGGANPAAVHQGPRAD
ncbi:MAG TPA: peptidylprolyl isomerase [Gemmataceae bacterium]|nr:peptidylprolyl isomerase [Gemmataceae bacterium]